MSNVTHPRRLAGYASLKNLFVSVGGISTTATNTWTMFDASNDSWSEGVTGLARYRLVGGGTGSTMLFSGGYDSAGDRTDYVDILDVDTLAWTNSSLPQGSRAYHASASYGDLVGFAGGYGGPGSVVTADVSLYDVATKSWRALETLSSRRYSLAGAGASGWLVWAGGYDDDSNWDSNAVECYNVVSGNWDRTSLLLGERRYRLIGASLDQYVFFSPYYTDRTLDVFDMNKMERVISSRKDNYRYFQSFGVKRRANGDIDAICAGGSYSRDVQILRISSGFSSYQWLEGHLSENRQYGAFANLPDYNRTFFAYGMSSTSEFANVADFWDGNSEFCGETLSSSTYRDDYSEPAGTPGWVIAVSVVGGVIGLFLCIFIYIFIYLSIFGNIILMYMTIIIVVILIIFAFSAGISGVVASAGSAAGAAGSASAIRAVGGASELEEEELYEAPKEEEEAYADKKEEDACYAESPPRIVEDIVDVPYAEFQLNQTSNIAASNYEASAPPPLYSFQNVSGDGIVNVSSRDGDGIVADVGVDYDMDSIA